MIARHHISLFFLTPSLTCLFLPISPFQPMPYLLNPASVTALNAKALPRQMIKVSSQFTLQCIDLMFPNLPGLSLMLPRTFRIFHSVPPFPAFVSPSLSFCACICVCVCVLKCEYSVCNWKYGWQRCIPGHVCIWFDFYILSSSKNWWFKITDPTQNPAVIHMWQTTSKPSSFHNVIIAPHSPAVSNIVLE